MSKAAVLADLGSAGSHAHYVPIAAVPGIERLPFVLRIVLENLLRQTVVRGIDTAGQVGDLMARRVGAALSFYPTRIFGQDILGKVMMVDMAAMRDALASAGRDPRAINPAVPVDIIIDHSLQVDVAGTRDAPRINRVRVVPPGKGIMHQIHIERLGQVVWRETWDGRALLSPDTCIGTDSHTPMINGLGILGWGVGGIEAEAVMLGKPVAMALPRVVGVEVTGTLADGVLPTDLVLTITELLRKTGVVGDFVEFFGPGVATLSVADRGTIANMAPEYGATAVYFPIDQRTIDYLHMTGRDAAHIATTESYAMAQRLWRHADTPTPDYDMIVRVDLASVRPSIAGPKNPEDRMDLSAAASRFSAHTAEIAGRPISSAASPVTGTDYGIRDGDIVIAAITSCTNTSNPTAMIAAGLVARAAAARGLTAKPWVKTSLAPGSQVVAAVLEQTGLQHDLDALGFHVVGFGCTTCNGGSGPLAAAIANAIEADKRVATAVLSGNRNFQGRIHPNVRAAYLASPALVVAYAIAGSMTVDVTRDPLSIDPDGREVFLRDLWPSADAIAATVARAYTPVNFTTAYADLFDGGPAWDALKVGASAQFPWQADSSYIRRPPYFDGLALDAATSHDIRGARALAILGDNITTDDISPSGAVSLKTPAADFMLARGIKQADFNNYTTRRGNHEIAVRATFANIRLRNRMVLGVEGGMTKLQPDGTLGRIFETAEIYATRGTPLVVIAGKNYGCGSSRDWAAKGVALLGVKAIIAEGFERIHRTNLVGMGVLPLQFVDGVTAATLGLGGSETFDISGLDGDLTVGTRVTCRIVRTDGTTTAVELLVRLDTPDDIDYWRHGGILPSVWRDAMAGRGTHTRPRS
jgi:aconitate hydratase